MKIPALFFSLTLLAPFSCAQDAAPVISAPELNAGAARLVATIQNPQIKELSGLAASQRYPGLLYAHNDSGDSAQVFLLNQKGGTVATIDLKGAYARDWEDIAVSEKSVFVADIGDNLGLREATQIYRFAEPDLDPQKMDQKVQVKPQVSAFRMPGTPRDAETLLVAPGGKIQILSKERGGSALFGATYTHNKTLNLRQIGSKIELGAVGIFTKLATGGDFSPDGRKLVVATYAQIHEWVLPKPFDTSKLAQLPPVVRALPGLRQCESVCYSADGRQIFVSSEGTNAPIHVFPSAF